MNLSPEAFLFALLFWSVCGEGSVEGGEFTVTSLANKKTSVNAKIAKKCRPSSHSKVDTREDVFRNFTQKKQSMQNLGAISGGAVSRDLRICQEEQGKVRERERPTHD